IIIIFNIMIIIFYSVSIVRLAIKIIKESEFVWSIIVASINMFILKKIYLIVNLFFRNDSLYEVCKMYVFAGFSIFVTGLFIEIISKVKENDSLKEELEVFYTLTEENNSNNVIVYNEKNQVIYANELMRSHEEIYSDNIREIYENINNLNKEINCEHSKSSKDIGIDIEQCGYFKDVVILEEGTVIKLDAREVKINEKKLRTVVSFRDVTEEYNRQRELKINENKFITITESIKDIISTIDVDGTITYVNSMGENIVGYTKEELLGKNYTMLLDDTEELTYNFIKSNYEDSAFMCHKVICKDKSVIGMESVVSKIYSENNEVVGHAIVSRDIGYKNEFELLKLKYDEIKQYDRIRNEFFANLSHEVRTPINIIYSCFQLLNNQKVNGPEALALYYDKYEKTIKQNCFRMLRLVNNLIDITKIDSGFVKMRFGNYDIINLVEDITLSVVPYVEVKKINIMFDTEVEELDIKCDPDDIERVILNLLSNAIKFNEVGGNILVNISVNEKWVEISVKDTGIGIAKELRHLVFERFMQTDKSLNREKEGSGIGLALVKSLVELHNGEVYINEEIEVGSEFIVRLPNVLCEVESDDIKNISGNNTKPTAEKISIELSDIYDLV
ncbi:MAG: PAS domain-containing sensor histidine kinase, partial [Clostridium sp.]